MTSTGAGSSGRTWSTDLGLASALADGVVVMAEDGTIVWANAAFSRLIGEPIDALVGTSGLDRVHPDELERSVDGLVFSTQFPDQTSVAPYRIRRGDGSWLHIELKSGVVTDEHGDNIVLVVRDGGSRQAINEALRSVASGEPVDRTAMLIGEAISRRWTRTGIAVSFGDVQGQQVVGLGLSRGLVDHARGTFEDPDVLAPWIVAGEPGQVVIVDRSSMAASLAELAAAEGYEGFAAIGVEDPSGDPCCIVVWFEHTVIGHLEFRHAAPELAELFALGLERRHHSWQLWHLARHDALTGLLNRIGFFEQLEAEQAAARRHEGQSVAVLYLDLDDLKIINDREGHAAGDRLLAHVGRTIAETAGDDALVARIGGDEFVVVQRFASATADAEAERLADRLVSGLAQPEDPTAPAAHVSIGIVVDPSRLGAAQALERADAAMYRAKAAGRARWSY